VNAVLVETILPSGSTFQLVQGDITSETSEAIVNAANEYLKHGAGVAGAISRLGGLAIQAESDAWVLKNGPVSHANPAWTSGGKLPCKYVIHAVGPVWGNLSRVSSSGIEDINLEAAVMGSLRVADGLGVGSVSLPAISTGIFGFPMERAAQIILKAVQKYSETKPDSGIKIIRLVLFDGSTALVFEKVWHDHFYT
jgi:O-acetyl-ADP-ribose deacetylase (regulator of RNase III)